MGGNRQMGDIQQCVGTSPCLRLPAACRRPQCSVTGTSRAPRPPSAEVAARTPVTSQAIAWRSIMRRHDQHLGLRMPAEHRRISQTQQQKSMQEVSQFI